MNTVKHLLLFCFFSLFFQNSFAQKWKMQRSDLNFGAGTANYFGDIGGTADENNLFGLKDIRIAETKLSYYFGVRYKLRQNLAVKFNVIHGKLTSTDAKSRNYERNLSFSTSIWETTFQAEYYIIPDDIIKRSSIYGRKGQQNNFYTLSSYVFGGAGNIIYTPTLSGNTAAQNPDEISGYGKLSLVFPIGVGVKYSLGNNWSVGLELGGRLCLSDYIDGFKSEYSHMHDIYYFSSLVGVYKLKNDRNNVPLIFKRVGGGMSGGNSGGINRSKPKKYKKPKPNKPPKNKSAKMKPSKTKKYKR